MEWLGAVLAGSCASRWRGPCSRSPRLFFGFPEYAHSDRSHRPALQHGTERLLEAPPSDACGKRMPETSRRRPMVTKIDVAFQGSSTEGSQMRTSLGENSF